ncbi:MAG: sulfur carrier protein ThiS [Candidatus Latescibacterota bacterium]
MNVEKVEITVNGESRRVGAGTTIAGLLHVLGLDPQARGIAVAVDGEISFRHTWGDTALRDGARVEIVRAVAGG